MKYTHSYTQITTDTNAEQVWEIWSDISQRHLWDTDTEWAEIKGAFTAGNSFRFKPVGGPKINMHITEATPNHSFTDRCNFPGATLHGIHELSTKNSELCIKTTMIMQGPLAWLWQKIVGNSIVKSLPKQTELLINAAKQCKRRT